MPAPCSPMRLCAVSHILVHHTLQQPPQKTPWFLQWSIFDPSVSWTRPSALSNIFVNQAPQQPPTKTTLCLGPQNAGLSVPDLSMSIKPMRLNTTPCSPLRPHTHLRIIDHSSPAMPLAQGLVTLPNGIQVLAWAAAHKKVVRKKAG